MNTKKIDVFAGILQIIQLMIFVYAVAILVLWFRNGHQWFHKTILPLHAAIFSALLKVTIMVLIPFMVIRPTRPYASLALYQLTYVFGGIAWFNAAYYCLNFIGTLWFIVGLFIAGVGVAPVAVIGSVIKGHWWFIGPIAIQLSAAIGCRVLYAYADSAPAAL